METVAFSTYAEMVATNQRLNRRCQQAEAALVDYKRLTAAPPDGDGVRFVSGSLGRAFLVWECDAQARRIAELEAMLAASGDSACIDWLERKHTLHGGVDMLYVVDGYELQLTHDSNPVGQSVKGEDLREVLNLARRLFP